MAKTYSHPHFEISVADHSIYTPLYREILPAHLPIFFMKAQQGVTNVPIYVKDSNAFTKIFGDGTLDNNSVYYSRESLFLSGLFQRQGAFIVRLAPEDAATGSVVLQLKVQQTAVPMYQTNADGAFVYDEETGKKIPVIDSSTGEQVKEDGVALTWSTRSLTEQEDFDSLKPTTIQGADGSYTVYPILALKATSAGAFANEIGVKLFVDLDDLDTTLAERVNSIPYSIGFVRKTYGQDTVSPILSGWNNQFESFVAKPGQVNSQTASNVSFAEVLEDNFKDLPFNIHLYDENIEAVGKLVQAVEPDDDTISEDPFMVNLCEAYNINGIPMQHVLITENSVRLYDSTINYMAGGADGDISDANIEKLTVQYLNDLIYPAIRDQARYPFNTIYDTGVSLNTKYAFIKFLGVRDDFRLYLSTQDCSAARWNTQAEDYSAGSALFAKALLQPESTVKGTECFRVDIYQQSIHLNDLAYRKFVPMTYDIMLKKSRYASTPTVTGQPAGLPASEITIAKSVNWTPSEPDLKQKSWDSGLNYAQYFDMTGIHWPAMRTVYKYDTSVLSNSLFADVVVYIKQLARYNWSRFTGIEGPFSSIKAAAETALSNDINGLTGGRYACTVTYDQTEEEAKIGYISHCDIDIVGDPQTRIFKYNINCYRSGYTEEA